MRQRVAWAQASYSKGASRMIEQNMSRRNFLTAAAGTAAVASVASSVALADEVANTQAANPAWLGEEPEDGDIADTKEC